MTNAAAPTLSVRQTQIICLIAQGMTKDCIARRLYISVNSVKVHRVRAGRVLNIPLGRGNAALVAAAFEYGILEPTSTVPCEIPTMSPIEETILRDIAAGYTNQEIANRNHRSLDGVKTRLAVLTHKWSAKNRTHLIYLAYMSRFLQSGPSQFPMLPPVQKGHLAPLSERETVLLRHMADGLTREGMAEVMEISDSRVVRIIADIHSKLGATNAAHTIAMGYYYGYLTVDHVGPPCIKLDDRTIRIINGFARGYDMEQVSEYVDMSRKAIGSRMTRAATKLGAVNRPNLISRAFQTGNLIIHGQADNQ